MIHNFGNAAHQLPSFRVHIVGVPGSGKTWLCQQFHLARIQCIDTDDVFNTVFQQKLSSDAKFRRALSKKPPADINEMPKWLSMVVQAGVAKVEEQINIAKQNHKPIVVVGITLGPSFEGIIEKFFIKMSYKKLKDAYRRVMQREIDKVVQNQFHIKHILSNPVNNVNALSRMLQVTANIAIQLDISFRDYVKSYYNFQRFEKKQGTIILSQEDILKTLISPDGYKHPGNWN